MSKLLEAMHQIKKLHAQGKKMESLLQKKPGAKYLIRGEYERVGAEFDVSAEKARKMVAFSQRYSTKELGGLVEECEACGRAIGFDVIIRLLAIDDHSLREKLQREAIAQGWSKAQVTLAMKKLRATGDYRLRAGAMVDPKRRGKSPKAVRSVESLLGELTMDASKWHRIASLIQNEPERSITGVHWNELTSDFQADLRNLLHAFSRFSEYEE
jgi:hypothetical protein